jgi:4-amino-4-deoxy-L-arabinose transferase-like glycosyltransferase
MKKKNRHKRITNNLRDKLTGPFVQLGYKERRQLIAVCILSVVVRIIYLLHLKASIFFESHVLDSTVIDLWAKDIVAGNFWGNTAFFRAPLYIYIVAFIYQLVGTSHLAIISFQNVLGLITIVITYLYCLHLFNHKVAFLTGIILSFWPTLVFFEGELMITSLSVFFALLSVFLLHQAIESRKPANFFVAGIVLGLSAITNPTLLPIFLIIPFYHIITKDKTNHIRMLKLAAIYLLGLIIPIIPVTVRNAVVAHDLVFISTQGGANFYIGNGKRADGISVEALGPVTRGRLYYEDNIWTSSVEMAEYELGRKLKDSEVSSYWFKKALKEMVENPGRMLGLFIKKYYYFWHGQEIFNIKSVYFSGNYSWLMRFLLWKNFLNFPSGILFPLMFVGIFYAIENKQRITVPLLFLLIYSVTIMLFFVCSRFRQPIIPVAVLFSAYGIHHSVEMIRQKKDKMVLIGGSIFVTFLILLNLGGDNESPLNLSQSN